MDRCSLLQGLIGLYLFYESIYVYCTIPVQKMLCFSLTFFILEQV